MAAGNFSAWMKIKELKFRRKGLFGVEHFFLMF